MSPKPNPAEIHQRLWASACAIAAEMEDRVGTTLQPAAAQEIRFNGGIAPHVATKYAKILIEGGLRALLRGA